VRPDEVTYSLREGEHDEGSRLDLLHHGDPVTVAIGTPVTRPIPAFPKPGPEPQQPAGRAPIRRGDPL
jgi:alpha,alpha-trehalose phosphorylase